MSFIAGVYVDVCQQYWPVASENLTTACLYFCLFVKPFTRLEIPQVTTVPFRRLLWKCERSVNVLVRDGNLSDNDWAPAVILVSGYPTSDGQYWRFRLIIISPHLGGDIAKISFWMQREISFNFMVSHSERFIQKCLSSYIPDDIDDKCHLLSPRHRVCRHRPEDEAPRRCWMEPALVTRVRCPHIFQLR